MTKGAIAFINIFVKYNKRCPNISLIVQLNIYLSLLINIVVKYNK